MRWGAPRRIPCTLIWAQPWEGASKFPKVPASRAQEFLAAPAESSVGRGILSRRVTPRAAPDAPAPWCWPMALAAAPEAEGRREAVSPAQDIAAGVDGPPPARRPFLQPLPVRPAAPAGTRREEEGATTNSLLDSLDVEGDPDAEAAWKGESQRRIAQLDSKAVSPIPWTEVRSRLMATLHCSPRGL